MLKRLLGFGRNGTPRVLALVLAPSVAIAAGVPMQLPDWIEVFPGGSDQTTTVSAVEVDVSYSAPVPPPEVIGFYRERLTKAGVEVQASFNGIGTTIQASTEKNACVIRIGESANDAVVNVKCSRKPGGPAVSVLPRPTRIGARSPQGSIQSSQYGPGR